MLLKFKVGDRVYNKVHKDWGVIIVADPKNVGNQPYQIQYDHGHLYWNGSQEENLIPEKKGGEKEMTHESSSKQGQAVHKPSFQKGDRVSWQGHTGTIVKVAKDGTTSTCWDKDGTFDGKGICEDSSLWKQFEKIEPSLKVGDKVRINEKEGQSTDPEAVKNNGHQYNLTQVGSEGVVKSVGAGRVTVNFYKLTGGGMPPQTGNYDIEPQYLEKIEKVKTLGGHKVGDVVRVTAQSHGWGSPKVNPGDVGTVRMIGKTSLHVEFWNGHKGWCGTPECFKPASLIEKDDKVRQYQNFPPGSPYAVVVGLSAGLVTHRHEGSSKELTADPEDFIPEDLHPLTLSKKVKTEEVKRALKIGDKVKVLGHPEKCAMGPRAGCCDKYIGQVGTVCHRNEDGTIGVNNFPNTSSWCGGFPPEGLHLVEMVENAKKPRRKRVKPKKIWHINGQKIIERDFYDQLQLCYNLNSYTVIVGETGTGKSFACELLARELKIPFTRTCFDIATPIRELLGALRLVERDGATVTEFCKGVLLNALMNPDGGLILIDELNSADPAKSFLLHQILDTRKVYIKETGESQDVHPDVRIFATLNPSNKRYTGTLRMNLALVNRFDIIHANPFTNAELERIVPPFKYKKELLHFYHEVRRLIAEQSPPFEFSVRNVMRITNLYKKGAGLKKAVEMGFLNQALCFGEKSDYDACLQIAQTVFGTEMK